MLSGDIPVSGMPHPPPTVPVVPLCLSSSVRLQKRGVTPPVDGRQAVTPWMAGWRSVAVFGTV